MPGFHPEGASAPTSVDTVDADLTSGLHTVNGSAPEYVGNISIGTVVAGEAASVANSGTPNDAVLDFVLPAGPGVAVGGIVSQILSKASSTDFDTVWVDLTKASVGLDQVDNTSDAAKPVSTAQQAALDAKEPVIAAGVAGQYWAGDKTWQALDKAAVGLAQVDNTADINKPVSTAQQAALDAKEPTIAAGIAGQYWDGNKTWQTLDKAAVGLSNVDDTSDANKPVSTAQQTALDAKEPTIAAGTTAQYWRGDKSWHDLNIPTDVKTFGAVGDGVADDTSAIQAALDHVNTLGGGTVYFPEGTYLVSSFLTVHPKTIIRGAGRNATTITSTYAGGGGANAAENIENGSVLRTSNPINSSTQIYVRVRDITIKNTNAANVGAGWYDTGGTEIGANNVSFDGFLYGVVLEQSELVHFELCTFGSQLGGGAGVWLNNGIPVLTPGAASGYNNRISISHCQFNEGATTYGILDDGGYAHTYQDNNYNDCLNHIRAAGVNPLLIIGGEYEGAGAACIALDHRASDGVTGVGGNTVQIIGGTFIATAGHASISGSGSPGIMSVSASSFNGGGGTSPIIGSVVFAAIYLYPYGNSTGVATQDGTAVYVNVDFNVNKLKGGFAGALPLDTDGLKVNGTQVVAAQQAAIADLAAAPTAADYNALLAVLRAHGLIAT